MLGMLFEVDFGRLHDLLRGALSSLSCSLSSSLSVLVDELVTGKFRFDVDRVSVACEDETLPLAPGLSIEERDE